MIIDVRVKPNYSRQKIENLGEGQYLVYLKYAPKNNKANTELINMLSKYFKTLSKNINIKFGKTSNKKVIEVK